MKSASVSLFLIVIIFGAALAAQKTAASADALKVFLDFKTVLQAVRAVLVEEPPAGMSLSLSESGDNPGIVVTAPYDYAYGTIAKDHLTKIAVRPDLGDGVWEKVRYRLTVSVEPLERKETRVVVDAQIEALKRIFTGKEEWVPVLSNGNLEETFLLRLGRRLFGAQFSLETRKKNFWEKDPRYVPGPDKEINTVPKPDTKRW